MSQNSTVQRRNRKWSPDLKWSPNWTANDSEPQMIPMWTANDPRQKITNGMGFGFLAFFKIFFLLLIQKQRPLDSQYY